MCGTTRIRISWLNPLLGNWRLTSTYPEYSMAKPLAPVKLTNFSRGWTLNHLFFAYSSLINEIWAPVSSEVLTS